MSRDGQYRELLSLVTKMSRMASSSIWPTALLRTRADIMAKEGTSYGGDRRLYEIFGWPVAPSYDDYIHQYRRGGIAKRIVNAYPQATWRSQPVVAEDRTNKEDTAFELAWKSLVEKRRVFHYLERVDRLARIGEYAVLFLGFNDGAAWDEMKDPVGALQGKEPWERLLYLYPFGESKVQVQEWETDPRDERYGQPKLYQLEFSMPMLGNHALPTTTVIVHWSRMLHVAEDVLEEDLEGEPCLKAVLNDILDLRKTLGAASEAFFQQWPPGMTITSDKDTTIDTTEFTGSGAGKDMIEDFIHGFKRYLVLQGLQIDKIAPTMGDPRPIVESLLEMIAGTTGIPKRILVGSERGELASEQDETNWNKRIEERQQNWAEPFLLRPFIDRIIAKGVLAPPAKGEYTVEWQEARALSEQVLAEISEKKASALSKYTQGGSDSVMPPEVFLREVMGESQETVEECKKLLQELWDKDLEDSLSDEEELMDGPAQGQVPTQGGRAGEPVPKVR